MFIETVCHSWKVDVFICVTAPIESYLQGMIGRVRPRDGRKGEAKGW